MLKKQIILSAAAIVVVMSLFFFGRTVAIKPAITGNVTKNDVPVFNITDYINTAKQKLTPGQIMLLSKLENSVSRGNVREQQIASNNQLANFWKDSLHSFEPYVYYLSNAGKLENSEKNLTFAAQLILDNIKDEQNEAKLNWKTDKAIELFEQAIRLNPVNDDLKIGLGSCYIYGKGRNGKPQETMKGIQQLLAVVRKDSLNMKAQLALGVGGFVSGQYDKAIERLTKVINAQPNNLEAIAYLADVYAAKGNKTAAVKWYQTLKRVANNPQYSKEIDARIKEIQ